MTRSGWAGVLFSGLLFASPLYAEEQQEHKNQDEKTEAAIEESVVVGNRGDFTVITENAQKLVDVPGALGDPLSAVFSLPGVVSSDGEGGEPAVRGSSPSDNLYVVDFLPAGYVFHEFSNSVFSEFIIQDFDLYSSGFGPEHSNVTGAVFDIRLRDPKNEDISTTVDVSFLRSGIFTEGRVTENSAFYLSARKSLIHLLVPDDEIEEDGIKIQQLPKDDDYQFKYMWTPNDKHKLTLSANGASDLAEAEFTRESDFVRSNPDFEGDAKIKTRYHGQSLHYTFKTDRGIELTSAIGRMTDGENVNWGDAFFNEIDTRTDTAKAQLSYPISDQYTFTIGGQTQRQEHLLEYDQILFICTEFEADCTLNRRNRIADKIEIEVRQNTGYINNSWMVNERLTLDAGGQWHQNDYTDESFTHPRFSASYQLRDDILLNAKYGQYDRLPETEYITPRIGNPNLQSPTAEHFSTGVKQELDDGWSWNVDVYYKNLDDLPLALLESEPDADQLYTNGVKGTAYGFDLLINKEKTDRWYGWLALSYGKSERTNKRTGVTKNYYLDTPLTFNWVMNYELGNDYDIGWRWHIKSGSAYTPITGLQENPYFANSVLPTYGDPFSENLPTYSRLDFRLKKRFKLFGRDAEFILDIINALNQQNVTDRSLDYDKVSSVDDDVVTVDTVSPGILTAVGFRYTF